MKGLLIKMNEEVLFKVENGVGIITLNRPERLNALTYNMVKSILNHLENWEKDNLIKMVIIEGAGEKAFCAGGDVVNLRKQVLSEGGPPTELSKNFFYDEYQLNYKINKFKKPFVALIDGVTMGGGVGVSMHGSHVVSTEKTIFAMPETAIGLFPDVGGGWLLSKLPSGVGLWLGLTGSRLYSYDLLKVGLSNYNVESKNIENLKTSIIEQPSEKHDDVSKIINSFSSVPLNNSTLEKNMDSIEIIFSQTSIAGILKSTSNLIEMGNEFARSTNNELMLKSPTSLKITLKQILDAKTMSLEDELVMEYRMVQKCQSSGDFYEGVRAMLVDKDRNPQWQPNSLEKVNDIWINHFFESLGDHDLQLINTN